MGSYIMYLNGKIKYFKDVTLEGVFMGLPWWRSD